MRVQLPNNWRPRDYQVPLWSYLEGGGKRASAIWHRRAGKDDICLHWTAVAAFDRVGTYWHMLPEASQARKAIWDAVNPHTGLRRVDEAFPREIRETTREQEMFIRFRSGSTWQVVGSDNYNSLVGSPPIGVVCSEWALANPSAWAYLSPILAENGGWAAFITTPRGKNHAHRMYESARRSDSWFAELLTVDDTEAMPQEALDSALAEYIDLYGEEEGRAFYRQEFYCSFDAAILGAVYGRWITMAEDAGRVGNFPYDPQLPVHTAWDLGYDDATAIWWWQVLRKEVRVIDYYESSGQEVRHYCDVIKAKPYDYKGGWHWVPHDASFKTLAAGGRSIIELAWDEGVQMSAMPITGQQQSIEATRSTLQHMWFHAPDSDPDSPVRRGLDTLKLYHYEFDEKRRVFRPKPLHDWTSHAADALEIIAQVWREQHKPKEKPRGLQPFTGAWLEYDESKERKGPRYR